MYTYVCIYVYMASLQTSRASFSVVVPGLPRMITKVSAARHEESRSQKHQTTIALPRLDIYIYMYTYILYIYICIYIDMHSVYMYMYLH